MHTIFGQCSFVVLFNEQGIIMKLNSNTILITGGSSGIGLELSKVLIQKGNKVIICGKSNEKLAAATFLTIRNALILPEKYQNIFLI
jgi:nucleoside-diphosphate-sugar epimerase